MLENISKMPNDVQSILIYVKDPVLRLHIKDKIKDHFCIEKGMSRQAEDIDALSVVFQETSIYPFGGGRWFVETEGDELDSRELPDYLKPREGTSVCVYWFKEYGKFKRATSLKEAEEGAPYVESLYMGRLDAFDMDYLYRKMVPPDNPLKRELLMYLKKNYTYDVGAVCSLFRLMGEGEKVKTEKGIINLVGTGGNTPDSLVVKVLTADPKTDKGLENALKKHVKLLGELGNTYDYPAVKRFMTYNIETILYIKRLQVEGYYSKEQKEVPDEKKAVRVARLRRFSRSILDEIHTSRVINLKMCLEKQRSGDAMLDISRCFMEYLEGVALANKLSERGKA